jgi:hypothetical protein
MPPKRGAATPSEGKTGARIVGKGAGSSNSRGNTGQKSGAAGPRGSRAASCQNCGCDSHRNGVCAVDNGGAVDSRDAVDDGDEVRVRIAEDVSISRPPAARSPQSRDCREMRQGQVGPHQEAHREWQGPHRTDCLVRVSHSDPEQSGVWRHG